MDIIEYSNIREIINKSVKKYENNNAFIIKGNDKKTHINITYKQFGEDIEKIGTALLKVGLKGKRIAIIGKNRYEWAVNYYAILNGVGVVIPLDKGLPEEEIENSLRLGDADAIVFEDKYYDMMKNIVERKNTKITTLICMDKLESDILNFEELLKIGEAELRKGNKEFSKLKIDNNKSNIILFTSGTTSLAKAVELSHKNIASNISSLNRTVEVYETDVNMAFLPFHHTFGSTGLLFFLCNGAATVFCDGLKYVQKNLKEYQVSVFFCVPLIIEAMHKKIMHEVEKQGKTGKLKFAKKLSKFLLKFGIDIRRKLFKDILENLGGKLRFVISGAASIDKKVLEDFNDFGVLAIQGYGLTETSPVLCAESHKNLRSGSIGKPIHNVKLRIEKPNEEGVGEIVVKGPNVMKGYYKNEEATKKVLKNGWFYTGDLGYMDKDGFVYIAGREKNVIVLKNGKNVYPEELEILVSNLPYVLECMVFGIPKDDDLLLATKIVYNKDMFHNLSFEDIHEKVWQDIKGLNKNLCNYKHIKEIFLTDEPMIKTTTGKVKRKEEEAKVLSDGSHNK